MGEATGGVLRRGSDRIIAGVCSGLGQYFGVEPLLVRIVFVVLAVVPAGLGVILYLVLWFLMEPPAGADPSATRSVGDRLRTMGQEIREEFGTGVVVLLANTGVLSQQAVGRLGDLWPLLLVILGLQLILNHTLPRRQATLIGLAVMAVIVIAAVAYATLAPATSVGAQKVDASAQS